MVPARCSAISWRVKDGQGERSDEERNVAIPEWFWENCLDHQDAVLNWSTGRFAGRGPIDGKDYKVVASEAEFEVGAIVEIETFETRAKASGSSTVGAEPDPSPSGAPVGRRLSERWRPWVAELIAYIHDNGAHEGIGSQGQEQLIKAVDDALAMRGKAGLARSTVQPVVQAVLNRLRSAGN